MTAVARRLGLVDGFGVTPFGVITTAVLAFTALVAVIGLALTLSMRTYGRTTCRNWSTATGIRTKFVVLNWLSSGDCLAQTPGGRWVLNGKWTAFVQAGK